MRRGAFFAPLPLCVLFIFLCIFRIFRGPHTFATMSHSVCSAKQVANVRTKNSKLPAQLPVVVTGSITLILVQLHGHMLCAKGLVRIVRHGMGY